MRPALPCAPYRSIHHPCGAVSSLAGGLIALWVVAARPEALGVVLRAARACDVPWAGGGFHALHICDHVVFVLQVTELGAGVVGRVLIITGESRRGGSSEGVERAARAGGGDSVGNANASAGAGGGSIWSTASRWSCWRRAASGEESRVMRSSERPGIASGVGGGYGRSCLGGVWNVCCAPRASPGTQGRSLGWIVRRRRLSSSWRWPGVLVVCGYQWRLSRPVRNPGLDCVVPRIRRRWAWAGLGRGLSPGGGGGGGGRQLGHGRSGRRRPWKGRRP